MRAPALRLGDAVNLLGSLDLAQLGGEGAVLPFAAPPRRPLATFAAVAEEGSEALTARPAPAFWSEPALSLHATAEDLITAIFDFRVLPFQADGGRPFRLSAGALALAPPRRAATLSRLESWLGLPLGEAEEPGFVLLSVGRQGGDFQHEAEKGGIGRYLAIQDFWQREGRHAMARLRKGELDARQAQRYLEYFYDFGTHFVSRIATGQRLLQVFACRPGFFAGLSQHVSREARGLAASGPLALGLRHLLKAESLAARGRIVALGGDGALAASLAAGAWRDEATGEDSLFQPFLGSAAVRRELLASFRRSVPVEVCVTPQTSMMETFRAVAAARVMKGALLQRYGTALQLPSRPALASDVPVPPIELPLPPAAAAGESSATAALALGLGGRTEIPGRQVTLLAYRVHPLAGAEGSPPAPLLVLDDEAFANCRIYAGELPAGLLIATRANPHSHQAFYDAWRFRSAAGVEGEEARVEIAGDLRPPEGGRIEAAILADFAAASIDVGIPGQGELARRCLAWLAGGEAAPEPPPLAALPEERLEPLREKLAGLQALAVEAQVASRASSDPRRGSAPAPAYETLIAALTAATDQLASHADGAGEPGAVEPLGGSARDRFFRQKWRLARILARLAARLDRRLAERGRPAVAPIADVGLPALAAAVAARLAACLAA